MRFPVLVLALLAAVACSRKQKPLFEKIDAQKSGISFTN